MSAPRDTRGRVGSSARVRTSDPKLFKRLWVERGGSVEPVRRTGEARYSHPQLDRSYRANDRRNDVPAILLCALNALLVSDASGQR